MTAPANVSPAPLVGPFSWTKADHYAAASVALALDLWGNPGAGIQSELVRNAAADLARGGWPSLRFAWAFCHAARMLSDYDDTRIIADARRLGCLIANACLPGYSILDVTAAEFGATRAYIAKEARRAVVEEHDALTRWLDLNDNAGPDVTMGARA